MLNQEIINKISDLIFLLEILKTKKTTRKCDQVALEGLYILIDRVYMP